MENDFQMALVFFFGTAKPNDNVVCFFWTKFVFLTARQNGGRGGIGPQGYDGNRGGQGAAFSPNLQVLDSSLVSMGLDQASTQWGQTVNVVVNCAGIAVAQRVLGKKGPHSLEAFLKVSK
jgi:hypothetical protein